MPFLRDACTSHHAKSHHVHKRDATSGKRPVTQFGEDNMQVDAETRSEIADYFLYPNPNFLTLHAGSVLEDR